MIFPIVTAANRYPIRRFIRSWAGALGWRMKILSYESLPPRGSLPSGAYLFSDLERLTGPQRCEATDLWNWLAASRPGSWLLNHPERSLSRYELLGALHASGVNRYRAYRPDEPLGDLRFPVFVRHAREHDGAYTPLLADPEELERAMTGLTEKRRRLEDLLIVEFLDSSDGDGVFRKFAAFRVAGRILPRQLFFGRNWHLKQPEIIDPDRVREEMEYLEANPHEDALREIFELARIEYGRIDYTVADGRIQVFEINTNPVVMSKRRRAYKPARRPVQVWFAGRIREAFRDLARSARPRSWKDVGRGLRLRWRHD